MIRSPLFFVFIVCFLTYSSQSFSQSGNENIIKEKSSKENSNCKYTYVLFQSANLTWCYDVFKNSKLFIHQTSIPGLSGNEGFKNKSDAEKVARLVIEKLKNGEILPSITKEELSRLKVL